MGEPEVNYTFIHTLTRVSLRKSARFPSPCQVLRGGLAWGSARFYSEILFVGWLSHLLCETPRLLRPSRLRGEATKTWQSKAAYTRVNPSSIPKFSYLSRALSFWPLLISINQSSFTKSWFFVRFRLFSTFAIFVRYFLCAAPFFFCGGINIIIGMYIRTHWNFC